MMHVDSWRLNADDRARLQPVIDKAARCAEEVAVDICERTEDVDARLEMLQGACEYLAERMRETILQQVDRGEWAARGINARGDISITVHVDVRGAQLLYLRILPAEVLS